MTAITADNMPLKYFDTYAYVKGSREIKDPEKLAEYQVKQIESAIETAVQYVKSDANKNLDDNKKELATKNDISLLNEKILTLRYDMLKWMIGISVATIVTLGGGLGSMIAHGFHWF